MNLQTWYWVILIIWIILNGIDAFTDDIRFRRGGSFVLVVLLVILGFIVSGSPVK